MPFSFKIIPLLLMTAFLCMAGAGAAAESRILTTLPNGLEVYIIQDKRFPLVCSRLYTRVGSANEDPRLAGISHVLEHMVFKGGGHTAKGALARKVESLGGYLNAATSFDKTWYLTDMPAAHWREGMEVVRDLAFQTSFDEKELESEKNVVISELQRGEDSAERKLYENLQVAALKNTPYGRPIIGFENTIRAITIADLRNYIKKWYQPRNMMLLVAGDMEPAEVLAHAQKIFGNLENSSDLALEEPCDLATAAKGSEKEMIIRGPWSKVYLGIAMPAPGYADLRSNVLDVLCYLLAGDGTSPFYQKYKYETRLVDSIDVGNMSLARAGLLTITATLDPANVEKFWNELTKDLAALSGSMFTPEALERAKFNLEDSIDRAGETLNGLAAWKGNVQFDLGGEQGEENIRFAQRNVDKEQLQNAIKTWLDSGQARIRVIAPENVKLPDFNAVMERNWPAAAKTAVEDAAAKATATPEIIDLGEGRTLLLLPDMSAPYVSYDFIMSGGNAMLEPARQGLAQLTARLLTDGCGDLANQALEKWFAERAASVSARAGLQTFRVALTGPARFNKDYHGILRDILRRPRFDPQELMREVENMKSAIKRRDDQPLSFMFSKLNGFLFPNGQPYGYDSLGDARSLDALNVELVREFWTRQSGQPWTLAIAGDFDRDEVLDFVKSLPVPRYKKFVAATPVWDKNKILSLRMPGRNQAHLLQVFPTTPPTSEDWPALMLLQSILSGQSGPLFTELRDERGLGYTVTAFNRSMPLAGFMAFYIGSTPDKIDAARKGFAEIIQKMKTEPQSPEALKAAADGLLGEYLRDRQSLSARAAEAATDSILGYPQDFQKKLVDAAATLTPADIMSAARKYLNDPYEVTLLP